MADSAAQIKLKERLNQLEKEGQLTAQESAEIAREFANATDQSVAAMDRLLGRIKSVKKEYQGVDKVQKQIVDNENELIDIVSTLQGDLVKNRQEFEGIGKKASDVTSKLVAQYKIQMQQGKLNKKTGELLIADAKATARIARNMEAIAGSDLAPIFQETQDYASSIANNIESMFSSIPGGNVIFKALGGEQLEQQLQAAVSQGMADMAKSLQAGDSGIVAMAKGMKGFLGQLAKIPNIGMLLGIGAVIIGVTALVSLFSEISKKSHEISKATGMTYAQSKQLQKSAMSVQTSLDNQLSSTQDIVDVQSEMIAQFGTMSAMTSQQALEVSEIGNAFGYGAQQAAKVNAEFMRMGMSADQASAAQTEVAAEALKAGVSVGTVTKDIAENAKSTAKFFGGNVKALRKAAVQAAKMGMSIKDMASISEKLLDIEGSLAAQFEFQALSGKQINLDKARELALQGDIAGATKEVLGQVGSISDFNKLSMLEKKKLAEATGMEVDQLQKSLITQEKLGDLTDEQKAAMSELNLSAEELSKLSAEEIKDKLATQDAQKKMNASFESLTNEFKTALLPVAEAFMDVFAALSPLLKLLGQGLAFAFKPISLAVEGMRKLIDFIMQSTEAAYTLGAAFTAFFLIQQRSLIVQQAKNAAVLLEDAYTTALTAKKKVAQAIEAKGFFKGLASAAMTAFKSAAAIPFVGPALGAIAAAAAVALGMKYFKKTGDLAMSAGGGPIVSNPREGTIFQGTKNDEVAMGPGVIGMAQGGNVQPQAPDSGGGLFSSVIGGIKSAAQSMTGGGGDMSQVVAAINAQNAILNQLLTAMQTPPPVQIGSKVITELNAQIEVERSFTRAT